MEIPGTGLINETNEEYYIGQKVFDVQVSQTEFTTAFNTDLTDGIANEYPQNYYLQTSNDSGVTWVTVASEVKTGTTKTIVSGTNSVPVAITGPILVRVALFITAAEDNYGGYAFIKLGDIINNFLVAYVGAGKLVPSVKRTDVIFHAKRGLQEFSYDTLKSVKSQEFSMPSSLSFPLPQDYVNYVRVSAIDNLGVQHIIYPANNLTVNPYESPQQDSSGDYVQDDYGKNIQETSVTETNWKANDTNQITGIFNANLATQGYDWWGYGYGYGVGGYGGYYGRRYGALPEWTQQNGWFTINGRTNSWNFSSNLLNNTIVVKYVSDGLAYDMDTRVPKMAEEAMYAHILHAIVSTRSGQPEYLVRRLKQERSAKLRNAKIRLQNLKQDEIIQVMRNKSKMIKH